MLLILNKESAAYKEMKLHYIKLKVIFTTSSIHLIESATALNIQLAKFRQTADCTSLKNRYITSAEKIPDSFYLPYLSKASIRVFTTSSISPVSKYG